VLDDDRDDASLPLGTSSVEPSSSTDLPGRTPPAGDTEVLEVDLSSVEAALAAAAPVERRLHSDPHDFAGLYIRHRSSFTLHARRYLRDGRDADEVVQEAFLRLFLALPELETELQALAYCRRTITNLCIDRYRAQARRPSLVDLDSVSPEDLADDEPVDPVVQAEDAALVREAMSLLSPLHRAALVKREIEEKPLPLIAEELDIPEESVKHLLFRARRALRRLLAGTSLAPGSDQELSGGLARAAKVSSGGMAGFLLVLALSLGTGPDLRAIPVVGTDLPDLIPVTSPATGKAAEVATQVATGVASGVADAVSKAVTEVKGAVRSATTGELPPAATIRTCPARPPATVARGVRGRRAPAVPHDPSQTGQGVVLRCGPAARCPAVARRSPAEPRPQDRGEVAPGSPRDGSQRAPRRRLPRTRRPAPGDRQAACG
jgi:RNA polymerase sigma-70 factor (ECF subfamily)